ncbi:B12-binding domain-containing protein [Sphingorhabdus sp.]|uniref:cobalamin B12-binding domain-containing protein n=1 Tax=Sphingorhabdus sp. TaxID=1902408 RepID=UPI0039195E07
MATVFGLSELKSRLIDWRGSSKTEQIPDIAEADALTGNIRLVAEQAGQFDLTLLLENLVIPRLIADRRDPSSWADAANALTPYPASAEAHCRRVISEQDVDVFSRLSVNEEAHVLLSFVDECLAMGSSVENIFVDLLAPAARRLGEFWDADSEDFVGVTMGLWRIQEVLRVLTMRIPPVTGPGHGQRSALFSPMPGEQHSFGTLMVAECFQRAGWETDVLIEPTQSELTGKFATRHYDLIGLTVSNDCSTSALSSLVCTIKAVSSNPYVKVLLGGRVINEHPDLVASCGADATAADAMSAVAVADQLVPISAASFENLS